MTKLIMPSRQEAQRQEGDKHYSHWFSHCVQQGFDSNAPRLSHEQVMREANRIVTEAKNKEI